MIIKDFHGEPVNVESYRKSLIEWPSFSRKMISEDGTPALINCAFIESPCGCKIIGCGTLQFPLTIQFCEKHKS